MINVDYGTVVCAKPVSVESKVNAETVVTVDGEIKKPITVNAAAFVVGCENRDGSTAVKAKIAFCLIYLTEDGFKKSEAVAEAEAELPIENAIVRLETVDARVSTLNGEYVARCGVKFIGFGISNEEHTVLSGGSGIVVKERTATFDEATERENEEFVVSDEFETSYAVKEVLCRTSCVRLNGVESGVSRIIFDGNLEVEAKTLPFLENSDIIREKYTIPFRYELPVIGALPDMRAFGEVSVVKESIKVFTDEAKNKSSISVEVTLSATGFSIGEKVVALAEDAYSRSDEIDITKARLATSRYESTECVEERFSAKTDVVAKDGARIVDTLGETATVLSVDTVDGTCTASGIIKADVVFKNADNGTTCEEAHAPFSVDIGERLDASFVSVRACSVIAKMRGNEVELQCSLVIRYSRFSSETVECIADATLIGERKSSDSAITVVIPNAGDELWDVSKRLATDAEEITSLNPDLVFPLTGDERIIIYRQKI